MEMKSKRTLCRIFGIVCFAAMFVLVEGMDHNWISTGRGAIGAIANELVGAFLLWKGGVIHI